MSVLRVVFVAQVWKLAPVAVAPANQEPFVASETLAVKALESVWAVLQRYGIATFRRSAASCMAIVLISINMDNR